MQPLSTLGHIIPSFRPAAVCGSAPREQSAAALRLFLPSLPFSACRCPALLERAACSRAAASQLSACRSRLCSLSCEQTACWCGVTSCGSHLYGARTEHAIKTNYVAVSTYDQANPKTDYQDAKMKAKSAKDRIGVHLRRSNRDTSHTTRRAGGLKPKSTSRRRLPSQPTPSCPGPARDAQDSQDDQTPKQPRPSQDSRSSLVGMPVFRGLNASICQHFV